MYPLRDALIQAFMQRMQGVDHTAASYAADVVLQVLQQQGIPLQAPHQGASPSSMPSGIAGKSGPVGGVPPEKAGVAKTPGYDKPGYGGEKAAPPVDKGAYGKAAPMDPGKGGAPMDKGAYGKAAPVDPYGKGAPPDKGDGFKK
jgi:hypothetical protein